MFWKRALMLAAAGLLVAQNNYHADVQRWRSQHEAELKAEDGWLAVAGLFWLNEGANTAGSDASNTIVLPRGPAKAGVFDFHQGKTTFHPAPDVAALLDGKPAPTAVSLKPDAEGPPDELRFSGLSMFAIHRGDRYGIRLRDPESRARKEFTGLHWFPIDDQYRVTARFVAYDQPKTIPITNVLGQTEPEPSPGYVEFTLNGQPMRLEPVTEDKLLFFIFRDLTAAHETYPAGRFLYAAWPTNGQVELDFNKAENPPCAFTAYATCPLPPKQNQLAVRIAAGEKNYGTH
jgi:uncharacterized protein